ncbi:hypothetical protein CTI12_AA054370 [Artemisia annua]|uniref:CCHC-type domain-containing protein n=1 Tax=Artemisia annua TaxID=35608 RepID=A0A2U1QAG5_ARTAN|nr:hypothetical protein CTI12_AA054370 [Artemisia annua]
MSNSPTENYLLGKVIADNHIVHKQSVVSILSKAWKNYSLINISPWKNNFFKFAFENKDAASSVISNSPWSVMGFYVALQPWDSNKTLNEMEFNKGQFWVQAHDLPLGLLTSEYATTIAESLGTLIALDCVGEGSQTDRDFLRFRVEVNITKPIVPGFFIPRSDGKESWITLKYERLSDFCYRCGCLGHCRESCTNDVIERFAGKWSQEMRTPSARNLSAHTYHISTNHPQKQTGTGVHSHHTSAYDKSVKSTTSPSPSNNIPEAPTPSTTNETQSINIPQPPTSVNLTPTLHTPSTNTPHTPSIKMPSTTTTTNDCSNYYVTEPQEPDTTEPDSLRLPIISSPSIDVSLAYALSRLAMKRRHDEDPPSRSSVKRMKPLFLGLFNEECNSEVINKTSDASQCNNNTTDVQVSDVSTTRPSNNPDTSYDCFGKMSQNPPPIVIKRRGRPRVKKTECNENLSQFISDDLVDVPVMEVDQNEHFSRVAVAGPNQPHAKC